MIAKPNPWLRSTELKAETEGLIIAAQDQLLSLTLQDLWRITPVHSLCRICKSTKKRLIIFYLDVPNLQTQGIYNKAAADVERGRGFGGREKEGGLRRECKGLFPFALDLFSPSPPLFAPRRLGAINFNELPKTIFLGTARTLRPRPHESGYAEIASLIFASTRIRCGVS